MPARLTRAWLLRSGLMIVTSVCQTSTARHLSGPAPSSSRSKRGMLTPTSLPRDSGARRRGSFFTVILIPRHQFSETVNVPSACADTVFSVPNVDLDPPRGPHDAGQP